MFYSQFILAKKGPLGTIWIAAHLERKLRKNQVADTDIGVSVDSILFPDVPIALRLSSHLLLGVVRIYSRKVNYLFDDCSEALLKVKQAFRSTAVDLPPEESTAPYHSITLPETFDLDDFELPNSELFQGNFVDNHVSTREQITLQDSMEGVVYSTSQFGLDERFGDGDTSGLDLEELLLEKVAASNHSGVVLDFEDDPHASEQMTPLKQDENYEELAQNLEAMMASANVDEIGHPSTDSNVIEYAHAPCTPGLMEEPNLSNVQEASAFDDHMESEDHNVNEFAATENLQNADNESNLHQWSRSTEDLSLLNDMNPETVIMPAEESRDPLGSQDTEQLKPQAHLPSSTATTEHISLEREDLEHEDVPMNKPALDSIDEVHVDSVEPQRVTLVEAVVSPTVSHEASSLQEPCAGKVEKSCLLSDEALNTESPGRPDPENLGTKASQEPEDPVACTSMHVLQPCNALMNQSIMSNTGSDGLEYSEVPSDNLQTKSLEISEREELPHASEAADVQGEGCHVTGVTQPVSEENQVTQLDSIECNQGSSSNVDNQPGNLISSNGKLENVDSSDCSELPAPEKLLSVPERVGDLPDNLLVEATPDTAFSMGSDRGDIGMKTTSGKKRSFTESTLTVQSLNSAESLGVSSFKRTRESVPDDDDLLSSILVGRSSVLKLKPTPLPPSEMTSLKRARSAPRVSASKRKVLMDDLMVLHGDTIRQQLTSTEDIRRVRKKAPCTLTEIWMIQKQILEEEIFSEFLFTGSSMELLSLHNQEPDLSKIRVCQDDEIATSLEAANNSEFPLGPNVTKEDDKEVNAEDWFVNNDRGGELAEVHMHAQNQEGVDLLPSSQGCDTQVQMEANNDLPEFNGLGHELIGEKAEMEVHGGSVHAVTPEIEPSSLSNFVLGDMFTGSEVHPASMDESNAALLQIDESGALLDQKLDTQSIEIGDFVVDACNGNAVDSIEFSKTDDSIHLVQTEPIAEDSLLEEAAKGGTSVETHVEIQMECSAHIDSASACIATSNPDDDGCSNLVMKTSDPALQEIEKNDLVVANDNEILAAELNFDDKNPVCSGNVNEDSNVDLVYPTDIDIATRASVNDYEYPECQEAVPERMTDAEIAVGNDAPLEDFGDYDYRIDGHDTGFLNVDDDEVVEDDNDFMPSAGEPDFLENSGWSSRTRAVAKYLQTLFDKEAENGRKVLPMDNLVKGKTRKEASRMFFETLVLKTRDYIHVEQGNPFDNITMMPGIKLMKSSF